MIDPLDPKTLEKAREDKRLSRKQLADLSGVHETTILRIEKGEVDPRLEGTWEPLVRAIRDAPEPPPPPKEPSATNGRSEHPAKIASTAEPREAA